MNPHNVIQLFSHRRESANKAGRADEKAAEMQQLSLAFSASHSLMFLMTENFRTSGTFLSFLSVVEPHLILDMRIAPRLDFIGANRAQSFKVFESLKVDYKDMLGRVHINSYEEPEDAYCRLWESVVAVLDPLEIRDQPVLLLFDSPLFMAQCNRSISSAYDVILMSDADIHAIAFDEQLRM